MTYGRSQNCCDETPSMIDGYQVITEEAIELAGRKRAGYETAPKKICAEAP